MHVGNYSVLIPEGVERDSGHVALEHGRQYRLQLRNHDYRQCDAEVTIDGKALGTFRLRGLDALVLERMPDDHGRLTFYSSGTADAAAAGEGCVAAPDKGLIQVRFVPERRREYQPKRVQTMGLAGGLCRSAAPMKFTGDQASYFNPVTEEKTCGGITGLSGHSDQQFVTVGALDLDQSEAVTISVRLVTGVSGPRPLQPAGRGNPVPAPVG